MATVACSGPTSPETVAFADVGSSIDTTVETTPTTQPPTTQPPTTQPPTSSIESGVDVDRYCELAVESAESLATFEEGDDGFDPRLLEIYVIEERERIEQAMNVADPAIARALVSTLELYDAAIIVMEENDYDLHKLAGKLEVLEDPKYLAAGEAISAYDEAVCGIDAESMAIAEDASADKFSTADNGMSLEEAERFVELIVNPLALEVAVDGFREAVPMLSRDQAECLLSSMTPEQIIAFYSRTGDEEFDIMDPIVGEIFALLELCEIPASFLVQR